MNGYLSSARSRARYWWQLFSHLVDVLERLERRTDSALGAALGYLIHRALGQLYADSALDSSGTLPLPQGAATQPSGREVLAAIELAHPSRSRRDPVADELYVLLVLSDAIAAEPQDDGGFTDHSFSVEELTAEYHSLQHLSREQIAKVRLFPASLRSGWMKLVETAESRDDPLQRLGLELSVMRVIRALYASAIGLRMMGATPTESVTTAQMAWTAGESCLKTPATAPG